MSYQINDASAMEAQGSQLARLIRGGEVIYLSGQLGAGKTTWVRGFLKGLGHEGNVKSPTYTLVEPYNIADRDIYHFDLYRVNDPEELEAMGIRDYCDGQAICLIEWPERGKNILPMADLALNIQHLDSGRMIDIEAISKRGKSIADQL
ncbi:MAG: tRNA (adenosine(37)-N6)-threonylcarbamoyltransferase complex ATPase subunit type 1 TsaE [Proteobacteria bacterium]|nr:tRNA (adenosine(37)-N6)-threonylcarbamoyltransferase complex ATPase subunit type 1 TsaE [Pseudomonadota bacterium]